MPERPTQYSQEQYEAFTAYVDEPWDATRNPDSRYDIQLTHPNGREILLDTTNNRVSCREPRTEDSNTAYEGSETTESHQDEQYKWGLRDQEITDIEHAATQLMGIGQGIPLGELWKLGLNGVPDKPTDLTY